MSAVTHEASFAAHNWLEGLSSGPLTAPDPRNLKGGHVAERNYPKCVNDDCQRPMRPRGASAEAVPGTVAMGHKGQCKTCVQPATRARKPRKARLRNSEDVRVAYAASGLQSFLARRYARGVPPEGIPSIAYGQPPLADVIALPAPAAARELVAA